MTAVPKSKPKKGYKSTMPTRMVADREIARFAGDEKPMFITIGESDGTLICNCQMPFAQWCEHIEKLIKEQRDMGTETGPLALANLPDVLEVPIVPTHEFFVRVELGSTKVGDPFRSAHLIGGRAHKPPTPGADPWRPMPKGWSDADRFLGYLGAGEGRLVLRSMVVEKLRPAYRLVTACKSKLHNGVRWSRADKRDAPLAPQDWATVWCLMTDAKCQACLEYNPVSFEEDAPILSGLHHYQVADAESIHSRMVANLKARNEFVAKYGTPTTVPLPF